MPRLNKLLQTDTRGKIYEEREQGVRVSGTAETLWEEVGSCKAQWHEEVCWGVGGKVGERKWCNERKPVCMFHQKTQKLIMSKAMLTNTLKFLWKEPQLLYIQIWATAYT